MEATQRRIIGAATIVTAFVYAGCNAILGNSEGQVVADGGTAGAPAGINAGHGGQGTSNASGRNLNGGNGGTRHNTNTGTGGSGTALGAAAGNSGFVGRGGAATAGSGNTAGVGTAGRPSAAGGARPGGASGTAGRSAATGGNRAVGGASSSLVGGSGTGTTSACKSIKCGEGCTDNDPMNCGDCGHRCSMEGVTTRACTDGLCAPTCMSGRLNCNTPLSTDDDGCECEGTACCASGCQTKHLNGLGENFFDCESATNSASAKHACEHFVSELGSTYECELVAVGCFTPRRGPRGSCYSDFYAWCSEDDSSTTVSLKAGDVWSIDANCNLTKKAGTWK